MLCKQSQWNVHISRLQYFKVSNPWKLFFFKCVRACYFRPQTDALTCGFLVQINLRALSFIYSFHRLYGILFYILHFCSITTIFSVISRDVSFELYHWPLEVYSRYYDDELPTWKYYRLTNTPQCEFRIFKKNIKYWDFVKC